MGEKHLERQRLKVIKNAFVNLTRLGVGAAVALVLPATLTRALDRDHFSAWALLLQIAAYANFLEFGLQTAVARFVAQAMERGDEKERDQYISTAFYLLICAGTAGFTLVCAMAWLVPHIFKQGPMQLLSELRIGLILLAALSALALPTSAFAGVFIGLQKNEYTALASGGARLIGAALLILAVNYTHSLAVMASIVGGMNVVGGIFLYVQARRVLPTMIVSMKLISKLSLRTMTKFCAGLSVMSFAMFLIGGLDLTIVGYFSFSGVAYYSVASNMVMMVSGLAGAAISALIAPISAIHARGEFERLGRIVLRSTSYITQLVAIVSFLLILSGSQLLTLWVGPVYARGTIHILDVLVVATAIRMLGAPYSAALVGAGEHVRALFSPLFEGFSNLVVSLVAGYYLGSIGVAVGTLAGAIGSISLHVFYNMPRIYEVKIASHEFLLRGIVLPVLRLSPALAGIFLGSSRILHAVPLRLLSVIAGIAVTGLLYRSSLKLELATPLTRTL